METVGSHHIRRRHKGSRVSYGLGVLLLGLSSLAAASQPVLTSASDVAVLIRTGHSATLYRVRAHYTEKNSFLQTWAGGDVRLWRRTDTTEQWRLFRHWKNMDGTWSHRLKGKLAYIVTNVDGMFELYDAHSYELLYRISSNMPPGNKASSIYVVPGESGRVTILRLRELDSQDREFYSLHLATPQQGFCTLATVPRESAYHRILRTGRWPVRSPVGRRQTMADYTGGRLRKGPYCASLRGAHPPARGTKTAKRSLWCGAL